ncbi:MAG: FHA domain-containing protein [Burkholderiales bacterium]
MQQRETTARPRLLLSTASQQLRQIVIDKPRITIGRRPYNDIMLDDLTVSGEHAVLLTRAGASVIEDLRSRNGTLVNDEPVIQRALLDGDRIEIGIYRLQYVIEPLIPEGDRPPEWACLEALSGDGAGKVIAIDRPIVSLSDASGQVAVIARRRNGFFITHLEGTTFPLVNGEPTGLISCLLRADDQIELAGTIFRFSFEPPS